jgi:DUF2934 family protein
MPHEEATSDSSGDNLESDNVESDNLENNATEARATEELIRARTYQLFEEQICQEGHAEFDWQQAEAAVLSEQSGHSENIDAQ